MEKLDLSTIGKMKTSPLLKGLAGELKDPKCFKAIERQLEDCVKVSHKHKNATDWAKCSQCQLNFVKRRQLMKKLGFKSGIQYLQWKKIMGIIINKKNFQVK